MEPLTPEPVAALRESERRYRLLANLSRIVTSSLDLREVFRRAAGEVRQVLSGCDRVSLILLEPEQGSWRGHAVEYAPEPRQVEVPCQTLNQSAAAWVLRHRQPRLMRRLGQVPHPLAEDRHLAAAGYRAYVYLPLLCRDQVIGIWGPATRRADALDGWDLSLLREISSVFATALDNAAAYEEVARLKARLEEENVYLRREIKAGQDSAPLVGGGPAMQKVRRAVEQVAATDSTVLILGETGTGKERVAQLIHDFSPRRERLMVRVNCSALASGVLASELFGHEAGAFTGAVKARPGRFEVAHRGTLFLDEIAEVASETQVMLLRVLQERVIERVGGHEPLPVDVRVIAATNRDLGAAVAAGRFRADLFYRLNVFPLAVPPLRERPEDIPELVEHFIARHGRRMNRPARQVSGRTLALLRRYHWPGNVRELENLIERALIVSPGDALEIDPAWLSPAALPVPSGAKPLADVERQTILDALERAGGKVYGPGGAAQLLGLKPTTLYGKMRKHRIPRKTNLSSPQ